MNTKLLTSLSLGCLLACSQLNAVPLGSAFTYQGRLGIGTNAANGFYDLAFSLYDDPSSGQLIGSLLTTNAVPVSNGLFMVTLDFGTDAFYMDARWLAIAVKTNGASSFTPLLPRQPITPAPNALYAVRAGAATYANNANAAVTASNVTANAVGTAGLQANAVTGDKVANGSLTAGNVNAASFSNTFWKVDGNSGTTRGTHFMGTSDDQPLELKVKGQRALLLEPGPGTPNLVGGHPSNRVESSVSGAAIGGGGTNGAINFVAASFGTIAGGAGNRLQTNAAYSAIGGGEWNAIWVGADHGTIAGGSGNSIQSDTDNATVGGGAGNAIQSGAHQAALAGGSANIIESGAHDSAIGGGQLNRVRTNAVYATVPGGQANEAGGSYSLAAGRRAKANHSGAFVWADSTDADFVSSGNNQFLIRAGGGVGIGKSNPATTLDVNGTVTATGFSGNGAGITGLSANSLASGTVADARLSANVALRAGGNAFTGNQTVMSGNVGIGINVPQSALDVAGTVRAPVIEAPDNQPLEFKVNGLRVLRIEDNGDDDHAPNIIGGSAANWIASGVVGATISGGGGEQWIDSPPRFWSRSNSIAANYSTISGGWYNSIEAGAEGASIGGGQEHGIAAVYSTIGGGSNNEISNGADGGTIGGGAANCISSNALYASIGGGSYNFICTNAHYATIPGGECAMARSRGQLAYASGQFDFSGYRSGDAQTSLYVLRNSTTSSALTELFLNGNTERMKVPRGSSWAFEALVVGRTRDSGEFGTAAKSAGFRIRGVIQNAGGFTMMAGATVDVLYRYDTSWNATAEADDTNNALVIKVTGGSESMRWVASVRTTEVIFPE